MTTAKRNKRYATVLLLTGESFTVEVKLYQRLKLICAQKETLPMCYRAKRVPPFHFFFSLSLDVLVLLAVASLDF